MSSLQNFLRRREEKLRAQFMTINATGDHSSAGPSSSNTSTDSSTPKTSGIVRVSPKVRKGNIEFKDEMSQIKKCGTPTLKLCALIKMFHGEHVNESSTPILEVPNRHLTNSASSWVQKVKRILKCHDKCCDGDVSVFIEKHPGNWHGNFPLCNGCHVTKK